MSPILPPALRRGGIVRLVAPAGPFDHDAFSRGVEILEAQGFRVHHRADIFSTHRYLAGEDERRLTELQEAIDDPDAGAVWCVRGGYGCMRIIDRLDISSLIAAPKVFVGFSDVTVLHAVLGNAGLCTIHGPMVAALGRTEPAVLGDLWRLLTSTEPPAPYEWEPARVIRAGECRGRLVGGNLSLVTRLLGTPFQPTLQGSILLIEEVGEAPYRVDRMLTHLELAGAGDLIAGVVVGDLTGCENEGSDFGCLDVVEERIARWGVPAVAGLPVGHGHMNVPIPLGTLASLDCSRGRLSFEMPAVSP